MSPRRPPDTVMRLSRLGASHQTRLSFMRVLLRRLRQEGWRFDRPVWEMDARGVGRAVYRAIGPRRTYSLVAFAHDLPDALRSDRVIAEAWDATFALVDGTPDRADLDRLEANVPKQEAGRVSDRELVLSRANRSVRLWSHVVDSLAAGRQPDPEELEEVGYLMRTTAVYGSGKFGAADRATLAGRPVMGGPFRAEMLAVWLIRAFVADLVEHLARAKGGASAVPLAPALRRRLGIGNSTGLGMAPFLVNHPVLLHRWIAAREEALARVRALPAAQPAEQAVFRDRFARAAAGLPGWRSAHPLQRAKLDALAADCARIEARLGPDALDGPRPWDALWRWAEAALSPEGQELLAALMLEPHADLVDPLAEEMGADELAYFRIDGSWTAGQMRAALRDGYGWALGRDYDDRAASARFWYVSEAKLEPRLGERHEEPGAGREQPLDIARRAAGLRRGPAGLAGGCAALRDPRRRAAPPAHRAPRADRRRAALCRDPRQPDCVGPVADRHAALQARLLRRDAVRPALGSLGADHHVSGCALSRRARHRARGRLGLPAARPTAGGGRAVTGTIRRTLSEIAATGQKAARGAGCPWGLAEEAGIAARVLEAHGLPGVAQLAALLSAPRACPCDGSADAPACGLAAAAEAGDRIGPADPTPDLDFGDTRAPLLVAAPLLLAARQERRAFALRWTGGALTLAPQGVAGTCPAGGWPEHVAALRVTAAEPPVEAAPPASAAREVPGPAWRILEDLAARTLVPESAGSRAAGAGPGTADTD
jgi:hypothetical protein